MLLANRLRMMGGGAFGGFKESGQAGYNVFSAVYSPAYDKIYIFTNSSSIYYNYMFVAADNIGDITPYTYTNDMANTLAVDGSRLVYNNASSSIYARPIQSNGTLGSETRIETGAAYSSHNGFIYGDNYVTPGGGVAYNVPYHTINVFSFSSRSGYSKSLSNFKNINNATGGRTINAGCVTERGTVWIAYKYQFDTLVYIAELNKSLLPSSFEFTGRYFTATVSSSFNPRTLIHKDKEFILIDNSIQGNYQKFTGDV